MRVDADGARTDRPSYVRARACLRLCLRLCLCACARVRTCQGVAAECRCNNTLTFASQACPSAPASPCAVAGGCLAPALPDSAFLKYNATSGVGKCWGVRLGMLCPEGGERPFCAKDCYAKFGAKQVTTPPCALNPKPKTLNPQP